MNNNQFTDAAPSSQRLERIQLPPVGSEPDVAQLFLAAVMRSSDRTVAELAPLVFPDDMDGAASTVFAVALALARRNRAPAPALILDELRRTGRFNDAVQRWLLQAVTTGAERMMVRDYAAMVVAARLRALYASLGHALMFGAETVPESALPALAEQAVKQIRAVADRLDVLRGEF